VEGAGIDAVNLVIWAVFAVDYVARPYLSPKAGGFAKSHKLEAIVVAVPFLRPLRLLRLVSIVVAGSRRAANKAVGRLTT